MKNQKLIIKILFVIGIVAIIIKIFSNYSFDNNHFSNVFNNASTGITDTSKTKLLQTNTIINYNKWTIDKSLLSNYLQPSWNNDYIIETNNQKYALFFYNINEISMGAYFASFAIYNKTNSGKPFFESKNLAAWFEFEKSAYYAKESDCLIFKIPNYTNKDSSNSMQILLIKPSQNKYSLLKLNQNIVLSKFKEHNKDQIFVLNEEKPDNKIDKLINLSTQNWLDLSTINNLIVNSK